jgi:hypothetical protein
VYAYGDVSDPSRVYSVAEVQVYRLTVTLKLMYPTRSVYEVSTIFSLNDLLGVTYKLSTLGVAVIVNAPVPDTAIQPMTVSVPDSTTE